MEGTTLGRLLVVAGLLIAALGALLAWGPKLPLLGKLPGDFTFGGAGWRLYVPLGTSLLLSLLLTLVLWLIRKK
jgi:hypothetical protein